MAIELPF